MQDCARWGEREEMKIYFESEGAKCWWCLIWTHGVRRKEGRKEGRKVQPTSNERSLNRKEEPVK
jgi:hypothetical protein